MEEASARMPDGQSQSVRRRRGFLSSRFSVIIVCAYIVSAIGVILSLSMGSLLAASVALMIAGAVMLSIQLDIRSRMTDAHGLVKKELLEIKAQATSSHNFLVRIEARAKFRYHKLSLSLADQSAALEAIADQSRELASLVDTKFDAAAGLSGKLGRSNTESVGRVHSEVQLIRSDLLEVKDTLAVTPAPVDEEMLKKRFGANSSRLTKWFEDTLERQSSEEKALRETEIEGIRNVLLSALAIQRAEISMLASRLLEDTPNGAQSDETNIAGDVTKSEA